MSAPVDALDRLLERLPIPARLSRFALVGASGVLVNLTAVAIALALVPDSDWRHRLASAAGIAVSILTNFLINDAWTWGDRRKSAGLRGWSMRLGRFYLVSSAAAAVQWGIAVGLVEQTPLGAFGDAALYPAQIIGILAAMTINFVVNHLWTFRERGD